MSQAEAGDQSAIARSALAAARTELGVLDYARLAAALTEAGALPEAWDFVAKALAVLGEAEAWERFLGFDYPAEAPRVLRQRDSDN